MAIKINLKELFPSASQEVIIENINYNFRKLLELGVGEIGETGEMGLDGPPGPPGPEGDQGETGIRGSQWFVSSTDPSLGSPTIELIQGDLWLNSQTGDVYVWAGSPGVFIPSGFSFSDPAFLAQSGELKRLISDISIPGNENQFVTFKNVNDNADTLNDTMLLANFNVLDPSISNRDFSSAGLYNSLVSVFRKAGSRYHLVLGSLFNDGVNDRLTTQDETVKIKYDHVGSNLFQLDILLTKQISNPETSNDTQINIVTRDSSFSSGFKEHIFKIGKNPGWITGISLENATNGFGMGFELGTSGSPFIIKRDVPQLKFLGNVGNTEYIVFENELIGLFKGGISPTAFFDVNTLNQTYNTTSGSNLNLIKFERLNSLNNSTNLSIQYQKMYTGNGYKSDSILFKKTNDYTDTLSAAQNQEYGLILHSGFISDSFSNQTPFIGLYNTNANITSGVRSFNTFNDRINAGFNANTGQLILTTQYNSPLQSDFVLINSESYLRPNIRAIFQGAYVTPYSTNNPLVNLANSSVDAGIIHLLPNTKTTPLDGGGNYSTNVAGITYGGTDISGRLTTVNNWSGIYFTDSNNLFTETLFTGAYSMHTGSPKRNLPLLKLTTGSSSAIGNYIYFYGQSSSGTFVAGDEITQSTFLQTSSSVSRFKIGNSSKEWRFSNNGTSAVLPELAIKTTTGRVELRTVTSESSTTPVNLILNTLSTSSYGNVSIGTNSPNAKFHVSNDLTGNEFLAAFTGGNITYPRIGFTLGTDTNISLQSSVIGAFYGTYNWVPVLRYITDTYHRARFEQKTEFSVSARLHSSADLYLVTSDSDTNHGLGWYGTGKLFNGVAYDGPVLYGFSGGALATKNGGNLPRLKWNIEGLQIMKALTSTSINFSGLGGGSGLNFITSGGPDGSYTSVQTFPATNSDRFVTFGADPDSPGSITSGAVSVKFTIGVTTQAIYFNSASAGTDPRATSAITFFVPAGSSYTVSAKRGEGSAFTGTINYRQTWNNVGL